MKEGKMINCFLLVAGILIISVGWKRVDSKPNLLHNRAGDTASFVANKSSGWEIISSYLNQDTPDSVEFELILRQAIAVAWNTDQFVGTITNKLLLPKKDQKVQYDLFRDNTWTVRINIDGKCYLSQSKGESVKSSSLPGGPFVFPLKVRYRNN